MLVALTTVLVGFAHRPPDAAMGAPAGYDLGRFVLADGEMPALCGHFADPGQGSDGPIHVGAVCDACLIAGAPGLVPPAEVGLPVPQPMARVRPAMVAAVVAVPTVRAPVSRGPPDGAAAA